MKQPNFIEGVAVALFASVLGAGAVYALDLFLSRGDAIGLTVTALAAGYVIYLLARSRERIGRLTTLAGFAGVIVVSALLGIALPWYALILAGAVWLIRSLFFHSGLLAAMADLGLSAAALVAGVGTLLWSGSIILSIWSFFLVHALFVAIPSRFSRQSAESTGPATDDSFERAYASAQNALRALSSTH